MQLKFPLEIDLFAFFQSGKFDYVQLGQTKAWLHDNFPDPDDFGGGKTHAKAKIWRYGNLEFHFENDDTLTRIYSDYIADLDAGPNIVLNKWLLAEPERLHLHHIIAAFLALKWDFAIQQIDALPAILLRLPQSRMTLWFYGDDDGKTAHMDYKLQAFSMGKD